MFFGRFRSYKKINKKFSMIGGRGCLTALSHVSGVGASGDDVAIYFGSIDDANKIIEL